MDMYSTILGELSKIEAQHGVRILHAVESGSRAWGFASPDSDYDVRFVYLRPLSDYVRLDEPRDVIEWGDDGVLDINGWDIKKAMIQFARGNATLFEWSNSPIVYRTTDTWTSVYATAKAYFSEKAAAHHYYGTAMKTYADYLTGDSVRYKKYFYALRPLLAAQYIEINHAVPPVLFSELMRMDMPLELRHAIENLLEAKRVTGEKDSNPPIPEIQRFIEQELPRQRAMCDAMPDDRTHDWAPLNECFKRIIGLV